MEYDDDGVMDPRIAAAIEMHPMPVSVDTSNGLTESQNVFLEWLTDPSSRLAGESQNKFADRLGVHQGTLSKWKKSAAFRKEWERRLAEMNVSPDRLQKLMDVAYNQGREGSIKAIELYMKLVDRMAPDKTLVLHERDASDLSDAELADQLEAQAAELRRKSLRAV